mgnify:CR=1 FL=1
MFKMLASFFFFFFLLPFFSSFIYFLFVALARRIELLQPDFAMAAGQQRQGLTFFGTHLHAHSLGRRLWVDHVRDGKVLGTLGINDDYQGYGDSQSYQFYQPLEHFQPGDSLRGHCVFDTSGKQVMTDYGGTLSGGRSKEKRSRG